MVEIESIIARGFSSNVFVVKGEKTFVVDTGLGDDAVDSIESDVDCILLTHRHFDHTANLAKMMDALNVPAYAHPLEAEALRKADDRTIISSSFGTGMPEIDVKDLNETTFAGFEVIHTPGHTGGSICLYHRDEKILISGDTVFPGGGVGRTDLPTGDTGQLIESVKRLKEYDVKSIYPGHGYVVEQDGNRHINLSLRNISYL